MCALQTMDGYRLPMLSAEALIWDARFSTPKRDNLKVNKVASLTPCTPSTCRGCNGTLFEDEIEGVMVCKSCGLVDQRLIAGTLYAFASEQACTGMKTTKSPASVKSPVVNSIRAPVEAFQVRP